MSCTIEGNAADIWGKGVLNITHHLEESGLFSDAALMSLINANPSSVREVAKMDTSVEDRRTWNSNDGQGISSEQLFEAIKGGATWVNLGHVGGLDARYQQLLDDIMDEIEDQVPGLETFNRQLGILISSPNARVFYHADIPGQALLHVRGEKRIWLYPNVEPYLKQEEFERIITSSAAEELSYDPSFEDVAQCHHLKSGMGLFWPLNWPHRVVNGDSINVSCTVEYSTRETRRHYYVKYANGIMSQVFGYKPRSQSITGPAASAKVAIGYALRRSQIGDRLAS